MQGQIKGYQQPQCGNPPQHHKCPFGKLFRRKETYSHCQQNQNPAGNTHMQQYHICLTPSR